MKIALFHNLPPGGGKRVLFEFARRLRERGFEMDLYLFDTAREPAFQVDSFARATVVVDTGFRWPVAAGRRVPLRNLIRWATNYRRLAGASRGLAERIDRGGYDVALVQQCMLSEGAPYLLRHLRLPSAFYCAEPRSLMERVGRLTGPPARGGWWQRAGEALRSAVLGRAEEESARAATSILTCSRYSAEATQLAYGVAGRVSYPGVDAALFHPTSEAPENMVLSVGEMIPRKGHAFVVEAVSRIPEARRPRVAIAAHRGLPGEQERLLALAAAKGVALEILAPRGDEALVDLYGRAGVVASAPVLEPLGLVPLEAMSCGVPVVGIAEAGMLETIPADSGGVLVERDPQSFSEALAFTLGDRKERDRLSARGREYVRSHWNWDRATDDLATDLERTLVDHAVRREVQVK